MHVLLSLLHHLCPFGRVQWKEPKPVLKSAKHDSSRAETKHNPKLWFFGLLGDLELWIIGFLVFWNFGLLDYWIFCVIVYTFSYPESKNPIIQSSNKPKNQKNKVPINQKTKLWNSGVVGSHIPVAQ